MGIPMNVSDLSERLGGSDDMWRVLRPLAARLLEGRAIPIEEAARLLGCPAAEVEGRLSLLPAKVERDEEGRIVGFGLTLRPTRHVFVVDGRRLYTWCALDALLFPILLDREAQVMSPCVTTGVPVSMKITPKGIFDVMPPGAVLSIVTSRSDGCDLRESFCAHVNFFSSVEAAGARQDGSTEVLPVAAGFRLAQELVQRSLEAVTRSAASCAVECADRSS